MRYGFGDYTLDTQRYELCLAGQRVPLRPKVFQVLAYLLTHRDRVVSKEELMAHGWPGQFLSEETLSTCITAARQAVGDSGAQQAVIQTRRGYGYCFVAAVEEDAAAPGTRTAVPPAPIQMEPLSAAAPVLAAVRGPGPAEQTQPPAERRQLTVLFCDLVDSTRLAGQLDPEDYRAVLQAYLETCTAVVARVGGTIDTFLGDGALVCFGYPQAHDDDPQRAVRAGLEIVEALAQANPHLAPTWGVQLAVRIGIHTGLVVAEALPVGETRVPRAIVGEAPHIAARLHELAAPNTVVCSAATARLVEGYVTLEPLGPQVLQGVAMPVPVYRVVAARAAQTRFAVALTRGLAPLVGREPELALLLERWAQAVDGQGQVVLLSGEAGIGKSRLIQALTTHLTGEAYTHIASSCSPSSQQSAFYPVIDSLLRLLQLQNNALPAEQLRTLEATLQSYDFVLEEAVPLVAALLSWPAPAHYPPLTLAPERQKQKTLEIVLAWMLKEAERQPVCVVMEDLHWVDPSTLEFLTLLIDQIPTARLLLLLLFRPEFPSPWAMHAHCTHLVLGRLSAPQTAAMMRQVVGNKELPAAVGAQIVAKTDGVPLFIEELTKMVLESGLLQEGADGAALPGPLPPLVIPSTLHDTLMARLDRLGPVKGLAQLGATLGREFSSALLHAVALWDEEAVPQGLHQLAEAELLYQRGLPPHATYRFKHALIQGAAYQSLLMSTRQQYHRRIAQVLEVQFPDIAETQPELLAYHYTEAGLNERAIGYWQRAGQQARQRSAHLEAVQHLTQGLALLDTLPETSVRAQQELDLRLALGPALMATKGHAAREVEQTYARARVLCQQLGEMPQLFPTLRGLWRFYYARGALPTAQELGEQLYRLTQRQAAPIPRLEAHDALGSTLFFLGEYAVARTHLEQGIALIDPAAQRALALPDGEAPGVRCLAVAANTLWCLGYPEQAVQRSREALALAQSLAQPQSLVVAQHWAAYLHYRPREVATVEAQAEILLALATAQGFPLWEAYGTFWHGWALAMQGQDEAGLAQMHQGMAAIFATGNKLSRLFCLVLLAEAAGHAGQVAEGLHLLAEALATLEASRRGHMLEEAYRLQGALLLRQATPDKAQAEACFQQALAIARHQQAKSWELRAAMSLSHLWQQQGKRAAARELLAPIYGWFTEGFDTVDLQEAKALLDALGG